MGNVRENMADEVIARAQVYGLLAAIFRTEPEEAFLDEIKDPRFSGVLHDLGINLGDEFYKVPSPQLVEDLAIEFTKLFLGPDTHISPHESIFVQATVGSGGLWGEVTVKVKKFIESAGFDYYTEFTGLPDHISVELEFMQKLANTEAELLANGEVERADWCQRLQKKFIDEHLSQWAPAFCDAVIEQAQMPFYAQMSEFTKSYLEFINESAEQQPAQAM